MFFAPAGVVCSDSPRIRCRVEEVTWDVYGVYDCELGFCSGLSGVERGGDGKVREFLLGGKKGLICAL